MTTYDRALCIGKHVLFDSTDPADHALAAQFCAACPITATCRERLTDMTASAGYYGHPEGTWAGQLITEPTRDLTRRLAANGKAEQRAAEEDAYDEAEARKAHSAYTLGDRSTWARVGHLVYDRRRTRARRLVAS